MADKFFGVNKIGHVMIMIRVSGSIFNNKHNYILLSREKKRHLFHQEYVQNIKTKLVSIYVYKMNTQIII